MHIIITDFNFSTYHSRHDLKKYVLCLRQFLKFKALIYEYLSCNLIIFHKIWYFSIDVEDAEKTKITEVRIFSSLLIISAYTEMMETFDWIRCRGVLLVSSNTDNTFPIALDQQEFVFYCLTISRSRRYHH